MTVPRIVVGGEALMDLLVDPAGAVTARAGGGPFNVARTIGRLGVPVTFLGQLSSDRFGRSMATALADDGVSRACPEPVPDPTTLAIAELDVDGGATYRFYLDRTSAIRLRTDDLASIIGLHPAAVHVGTLGLVAEPIGTTLEAYLERLPDEVAVMVDPNCRPTAIDDPTAYRARMGRILQRADVVKVSSEDLSFLYPHLDVAAAVRAILGSSEARSSVVLLTAQADPATAYTRRGKTEVEVPPTDVVDSVGAGDAFGGAFLAWWVASGLERSALDDLTCLRQAVGFAVGVAAMTCQRIGADPPRLMELGGLATLWPAHSRMRPGGDRRPVRHLER